MHAYRNLIVANTRTHKCEIEIVLIIHEKYRDI